MYAAMSFAFLLIVVGIPLWWKTTEVYRVHVPYGRIDELKEAEIVFPLSVTIISQDSTRADTLVRYLGDSTTNTSQCKSNFLFASVKTRLSCT